MRHIQCNNNAFSDNEEVNILERKLISKYVDICGWWHLFHPSRRGMYVTALSVFTVVLPLTLSLTESSSPSRFIKEVDGYLSVCQRFGWEPQKGVSILMTRRLVMIRSKRHWHLIQLCTCVINTVLWFALWCRLFSKWTLDRLPCCSKVSPPERSCKHNIEVWGCFVE